MKKILSALALAAVAVGAHAELTYTGGTLTSINNYNPTGTTSPQTQGLIDPVLSAPFAGLLSATFLGFEALDNDVYGFALASGSLNNQTSAVGTTITGPIPSGNLVFTFTDTFTNESVGNGGNANASVYSSYVILGTSNGGVFSPYHGPVGQFYDFVLGFNDGLKVDADYDDMVVGLRLNPVPEPETYALMLAGLGAIGFIGRRRRKS